MGSIRLDGGGVVDARLSEANYQLRRGETLRGRQTNATEGRRSGACEAVP
jgi:hypothetical protein